MGIAIEAGQHGAEVPVREHKLALGVMAVDENRNGLE
jgi:hypothetical protein